MKKIILPFIIFFCFFMHAHILYAQFEYEGSGRYGRLSNFAYDHQIQGKIYASIHNKLLESSNNGKNWSVIYCSPLFSEITNLRVLNTEELAFQEQYGFAPENNIAVLNLQNKSLKRTYMPMEHGHAAIDAFDIVSGNSDIIFLNLFVSLNEGYGMYTNNAGQTWKTVYKTIDHQDNIEITSLAISDINPDKLVITRGSASVYNNYEGGGGLWISEDAGDTWVEHLPGLLLKSVAFSPVDDNEILVGTGVLYNFPSQHKAVYRTKDNGANWDEIDVEWIEGKNSRGYDDITGINFNPHSPAHIIILADKEIVRTTDDGLSWNNTSYYGTVESYYQAKSVSFDPFQQGKLLINNAYYPLQSFDGGITTQRFWNPFHGLTGDVSVYSDANETHIYYGVQNGYVYSDYITKEENDINVYPLDWIFMYEKPYVQLQADKSTPGRILTYSTLNHGTHYGMYLELSEDYGETKEILYQNSKYYFYVNMRIDPSNNKVVWLSLEDGDYQSALVKVDFADMNNIEITEFPVPALGTLHCIELDPENSSTVFIAIDNKIYRSEDGGLTWVEKTNELSSELNSPQDYILSIKSNPLRSGQYTLATNKGVFTTYNSGESWEKLNNHNMVYIEHSNVVNGHLVGTIFTSQENNVGVIYSMDDGENWEVIENDELNFAQAINTVDALFTEDFMRIFIGTFSLGVISYGIDLENVSIGSYKQQVNCYKIFPNPAQSYVKVLFDANSQPPSILQLYSIQGQKLKEVENTSELSLSGLESGIYVLKAVRIDGKIESFSVIKN